jgi:hypothetical protein
LSSLLTAAAAAVCKSKVNDTKRMNLTRRESYVTLAVGEREPFPCQKREKKKKKVIFTFPPFQ